jgi:hypothetical protein
MWNVLAVICFHAMVLSPEKPLCFSDAKVPIEFESETSCVLVRDRLAKDLNIDLNARNVRMILKCEKLKETNEKIPDIKPLSAFYLMS